MGSPRNWRIVLYVVLGLLAWRTIVRITEPRGDDALVIKQTQQIIAAGKKYRLQRAQDIATLGRLQRKTKVQVQSADSIHRKQDSILLPILPPSPCVPYSEALLLSQQEADTLRAALSTSDSATATATARAQRAEVRADTLETLLKKQPKPCRLLGVPCPTVGVGVVVGADLNPRPAIGVFIPLHL